MTDKSISRRDFVAGSTAAALLLSGRFSIAATGRRRRVALVGTGIRGSTMWGQNLRDNYSDVMEFVGLSDINPGRLEYVKGLIGTDCPTFTNFDEMLATVKPDLLIVTTVDATHDEFIIKGLDNNIDVLTEKPMTTDEIKCEAIVEAERRSSANLIVGLNYRYGPYFSKLRELLIEEKIGKLTSVDFNWYLNVYHGASYFRRWHGLRDKSGTLLVHKAAHHFDLLNWWIDSDPVEVNAYGALEHYGSNNDFRGNRCMDCPHTGKCDYFWDMRAQKSYMALYHAHEKYDGYIRDNCVWRKEIDIFDKMAVQIVYANNVQVSYSLTTYSPYEGLRIAFNGHNGRIESADGVPSLMKSQEDQARLHAREMSQDANSEDVGYSEIVTQLNFKPFEREFVSYPLSGHGGGDKKMLDEIFRGKVADPQLEHAADIHAGAMSVLIGIAARKSIDEGRPVRIEELTNLELT